MADEPKLEKFRLTSPDGTQWDVPAPDPETALKYLKEHRQALANEASVKQANEAPEWAKPFMAMRDVAQVGANDLTGNWLARGIDQLTGGDSVEMDTAARKNRMGWAAPALDMALAGKFLPSVVKPVTQYAGGGPLARAIVAAPTAATEGGVVGGVQAAGQHQDVGTGVAVGGILGAAGQQAGDVINKGWKWIRGIDDSVPKGIRADILPANIKGKNASPVDKVTAATNDATSRARTSDDPLAEQSLLKDAYEKLLRTDKKSFSKDQQGLMSKVVDEDPATKYSRMLGELLSNKFVTGGAGLGVGMAGGGILGGIGTAAALGGGSKILRAASAGGTKEAKDDLLRAMRGRTKYTGPISDDERAVLMKALRQGGLGFVPAED